jgi:uncharacterized protein (TIGR03643 family)
MAEAPFRQLNEQSVVDLEQLKKANEEFDFMGAPTSDYAEAVRNRFGLSQPEWKALMLGIKPEKFGAWRKRVAKRRAKNKVARRSRAVNAR